MCAVTHSASLEESRSLPERVDVARGATRLATVPWTTGEAGKSVLLAATG